MTLVVDGHQHFWNPAQREYPWMTDDLAAIRRRFGPEDLQPLLAASGVDRTVLVQSISSIGETREFLAMTVDTAFIAGVVGWVDLTDPDVAGTIADLLAGPGGRRLVGIRHPVHDEPDPEWLARSDVQLGIQAVGDAGLVYDLLVRTRELPAALEVVRRFPEVQFVIDHMAKPRIAAGQSDPEWEHAMAPFSDCANVACKLSGLVTEASWTGWTLEDLLPYVRRALSWFGAERCIYGSDWPVCLLAATYDQVIQALRSAVSEVDPAGAEAVFGGSAVRTYGLVV